MINYLRAGNLSHSIRVSYDPHFQAAPARFSPSSKAKSCKEHLFQGEKIAAGDIITRDFRFEPLIALFRATPPDNPPTAFRKLLFDSF